MTLEKRWRALATGWQDGVAAAFLAPVETPELCFVCDAQSRDARVKVSVGPGRRIWPFTVRLMRSRVRGLRQMERNPCERCHLRAVGGTIIWSYSTGEPSLNGFRV